MNNRVVHFEIPCDNPEKTMDFFKTVFDWNFQQFGTEEYWLAITGEEGKMGINGGLMKKKHPEQPVVNTIAVDSIDGCIPKIESAGGIMVVPKMPVGDMGFVAYFKDPDGNIHGIWELAKPM